MRSTDMATRAGRGAVLLMARTFGVQVFTFAATVALARLLQPQDYGAFAVALAVQQVSRSVIELGLPVPLVQRQEPPTDHEQRAVLAFVFLGGSIISAASFVTVFALLPVIGIAPTATSGAIVVALVAVPLFSFRLIPMVLLERRMAYGRFLAVEVSETAAFYLFAIPAAIAGLGVYSLAAAVPVGAAVSSLVANAVQPAGVGLSIDLRALRPLARFGAQVAALYPLQLLRELAFLTVFAATGGQALAGFYTFSQRLLSLPTAVFVAVQRVGLPALAQTESDSLRADRAARAAVAAATALSLPLALIVGGIEPLVLFLFGEKWLPTSEVVIGAAAGALLASSVGAAFSALALANRDAFGPLLAAVVAALIAVPTAVVATPAFGTWAAGVAATVGLVSWTLVLAVRAGPSAKRALVAALRLAGISAFAAATGHLWRTDEVWTDLFLSTAMSGGTWLAAALLFARSDLRLLARATRSIFVNHVPA